MNFLQQPSGDRLQIMEGDHYKGDVQNFERKETGPYDNIKF